MKILDLVQGSPEWLAERASYNTASDASVMMGVSSKTTRNELLRMKATGTEKEFSDWFQTHILDKGHEVEAMAIPIAEEIIGEELFPATALDDSGYLLASFDGITMLEDIVWECKQWNEEKSAAVVAGHVPDDDYWQVVQQLVVSGATKCLYMVTNGTKEKSVWCWKSLTEDDEKRLRAGWKQFDEDRANYKHVEESPAVVGRSPETLPALLIQVTGQVTASNLAAFKEHALAVFSSIKTELKNDEDFANAEKTVKWCGDVEDRLEAAKLHALSQTASIDELFRAIDAIKAEARAKRLELDKLVKARKESIRVEIQQGGVKALAEHVAALNNRLGANYMPTVPADFGGVMKGLKTIASLRNAVDTELARAKIEASAAADKIEINLNALPELSDGFALFPDLATLVLKPADDFSAAVTLRVSDHKQKLEAERERIRQEEQDRLARQQAAQVIEAPTVAEPATSIGQVLNAAAPAAVTQSLAPESAPDTGATIKLGDICTRLGFTVTAEFLAAHGFKPHATDKNAKLYQEASFPLICAALIRHIQAVANSPMKLAAGLSKSCIQKHLATLKDQGLLVSESQGCNPALWKIDQPSK